jgi:hypothetical protein
MIRAIIEGRKTMTRRVVIPQPTWEDGPIKCEFYNPTIIRKGMFQPGPEVFGFANEDEGWKFPYGKPGDRLYVRETWLQSQHLGDIFYKATHGFKVCLPWRSPIHMPEWASRIHLDLEDVRVERVQDIDEDDAEAEGVLVGFDDHPEPPAATAQFRLVWDSINKKRGFGWDANPWVWVIEFKASPPPS